MKKLLFALVALTVSVSFALAQNSVGQADPNKVGIETAQQNLKLVSVDKFEQEGFWSTHISSDEGLTQYRLFKGGPLALKDKPLADERYSGIDPKIADQYVLGVRTDFYHRGFNTILVLAQRPIPIEGITKTISVWVVGRNNNHRLKVIVQDFFKNEFELTMGTLNFQGWKEMSVAIPPQNPDGFTGIIQRNFHYTSKMGLKVVGFKIECDLMESFGTYYIYFDNLRAITDLFAEDNRDPDDMDDSW